MNTNVENSQKLHLNIEYDQKTGLPILNASDGTRQPDLILGLVKSYLPLPNSTAEFGCGKRTSVITHRLLRLGIPLHAIRRGMIMEWDMSSNAIKETDHRKRPHALIAKNPIYHLLANERGQIYYEDKSLIEDLRAIGAAIDKDSQTLTIDGYELNLSPEVGFNIARSHIFPTLTFWDAENKCEVELVIDPVLERYEMFSPTEMRNKLNATEATLFFSSYTNPFRLGERYLTETQRQDLEKIFERENLSWEQFRELRKNNQDCTEYNQIIRLFLRAEERSVGDPDTWSYANNIRGDEYGGQSDSFEEHVKDQAEATALDPNIDEAAALRENNAEAAETLQELDDDAVKARFHEDAVESKKKLQPLTELANLAIARKARLNLYSRLSNSEKPKNWLKDEDARRDLEGIGVAVRDRLERLADVSRDETGRINAMTFTKEFSNTNIELIRQMNEAGLLVYIDQVGNIHGLLVDEEAKEELQKGEVGIEGFSSKALGFHSHIDTVGDAGKFDGRLGVVSGIEIVDTLNSLQQLGYDTQRYLKQTPILVTAFVNEEMTFTGNDVSMPGSSAVAATAEIDDIYGMTNKAGMTYQEGLVGLIGDLKEEGVNVIGLGEAESPEQLIDPRKFLTKQSMESHPEQGPQLMGNDVDSVQASAIMGIHQEDFTIDGERAEEAALEIIRQFRELALEEEFENTRVTNAILDKPKEKERLVRGHKLGHDFGYTQKLECVREVKTDNIGRFILLGEKDHAGASPTEYRFDPGVAAAKITQRFKEIVAAKNLNIEPIIADFELYGSYDGKTSNPNPSRNVIPGAASISLGIRGTDANGDLWGIILAEVQEHIAGMVRENGSYEEKDLLGVENPTTPDSSSRNTSLSLSLVMRDGSRGTIQSFKNRRASILREIKSDFGVTIASSVEQELDPLRLDDEDGSVSLIMVKSFAGSHNRDECQPNGSTLSGILLQFASTLDFLKNPRDNIFNVVERNTPDTWKGEMPDFCSGALHDSCQVKVTERQKSIITEIH